MEGLLKGYGIKKTSISRNLVKATAEQMLEFMERNLSYLDPFATFIDDIEFEGQLLVVAIGIDRTGKKYILCRCQGDKEHLPPEYRNATDARIRTALQDGRV